jgi:predicted amino acid racemase
MFLDLLRRRNQELIDATIRFHQAGHLPANTYVLDADAIAHNAAIITGEAKRLGLTVFAMTKQIGRNPDISKVLVAAGLPASVAVDMHCARATVSAGMSLGHIGHLVQVPEAEAGAAAAMAPENWTVFNLEKAREAAAASAAIGRNQRLLARIYADDDEFYTGHEGGFPATAILKTADLLDSLESAHFGGITTFPALLFDPAARRIRPTRNLATLEATASLLRGSGREHIEINAPGTTSTVMLQALADAGATQVEPGHALSGTTPLHALQDLPERPAICYLSEVSHLYGGRAYCFGGGTYVDPVFPAYQVKAIVGRGPESTRIVDAKLPPAEAIDYYAQLFPEKDNKLTVGESVVFGFRAQAFVTRAYTAAISGLSTGNPHVEGIWSSDGAPTTWPY